MREDRTKRWVHLILASVLAVTALSCALFNTPTPIAFPTATEEAAVDTTPTVAASPTTALGETETPTPPTATATATVTPLPATATATPSRITFGAGATEASVAGKMPADGTRSYVLSIGAGQFIEVNAAPNGEGQALRMSITGADGEVIKPLGEAHFRGVVPTTQDYVIRLEVAEAAGASSVDYGLSVLIPVRIAFRPGDTSATFEDRLQAGAMRQYAVRGLAGQMMTVDVTATEGEVRLIIWGADGTVLMSGNVVGTTFEGPLPSTQDYIVGVQARSEAPAAYVLEVMLPPSDEPSPTPAPDSAMRLTFTPGATSISVDDQVPSGSVNRYVLAVMAEQLMEVALSPQAGLRMEIIGEDGTVVKPEGPPFFRGTVPATQDYVIAVASEAGAVDYTMQVIIPMRIVFSPGGTTTEVEATLPPFTTGHYVIRALAGQTMTLEAAATTGEVILIVYGADGTVLQTDHAGASSFSGILPSTQDYLIDVRSVGGTTANVAMTVAIPPP